MFDGLDDAYALTPLQQGMLYETLKNPDSDIYVAYIVIDIHGGVSRDLLCRAWEQTVQQHETLRTRFVWEGLDEPLQLVNSSVALDWSDCLPLGDDENGQSMSTDAAVEYWLKHERSKTLSLSTAPPVRFRLLTLNSEHSVLIWTVHHLLADDWSTPLVLQTLATQYHALTCPGASSAPVKGAALRYAGYVDWLSQLDQNLYLEWWRQALCDVPETPMLFEQSRPSQAEPSVGPHHRHDTLMSEIESRQIDQLANTLGVTLSSIVHAAWALVVARYAGTDEAVFGTSVSGRTCPLPDVDQSVGLFLNTLPSRVRISAELTRDEFVTGIQNQLFEQIAHEHMPLVDLMKLVPDRETRTLFESVLVVETHGTELSIEVPDSAIRFDNIRYVTDSNFPLTVLVFPGKRLQLQLVGPTSGFRKCEMAALSDEFVAVLTNLCVSVNTPVATLLDQQSARMAHHYDYHPLEAPPRFQRMERWIESQVLSHAEHPAIIDDGRTYSYAQLWCAANCVANAIKVLPENSEYVGICLGRGFDQIAAIVGVLLSGHAYIPIDPAWPTSRMDSVLSDVPVTCLVCNGNTRMTVAFTTVKVLMMEDLADPDREFSGVSAPFGGRMPSSPAYMIYTSGSTGKPKGVSVSHANLAYSTAARIARYAQSPERYLLLSSFSFDSSIAGIFWTLCTGGTLVLPGESQAQDIHEIERQIAEHAVTHTLCLPSLYALLLRFSDARQLDSLRLVMVAGEACPVQLPKMHNDRLPHVSLFNEYGPTEATVWASVADISQWTKQSSMGVPIGRAIPGTHIEVTGPLGQVCCPGISGELVVSSPGVVEGYYSDDALTQSRFTTSQSNLSSGDFVRSYKTGDMAVLGLDGQLYFLGRTDSQLKVRGHRIEAGEIEMRVERHTAVHEACCVLETDSEVDNKFGNEARLVCYYTLITGQNLDNAVCTILDEHESGVVMRDIETAAAARIKQELPGSFTVSCFVGVNVLPRLSNGKVNVQGFPVSRGKRDSDILSDAVSLQQSTVLNQLCTQLAALLNVTSVQPHDNFFSLGGDSLTAIRYVAVCREQGIMLTVPMVATTDTLAELADTLERHAAATRSSLEPPAVESTGSTPLTPVQRWFFSLGLPRNMRWSMACRVHFDRAFPAPAVEDALHKTLTEFPVLSTRFTDAGHRDPFISDYVQSQSTFRRVSSSLPEPEWQQSLAALQDEFDLETGALLRCLITVDNDDQCYSIGLVLHHLVTDALSNWHFSRRLTEHLYANTVLSPSASSVFSFREWALMLNRTLRIKTAEKDAVTTRAGTLFKEQDCVEHRLPIDTDQLLAIKRYCQRQAVGVHEYLLFLVLSQAKIDGPVRVDVETHGRDILDLIDSDGTNDVVAACVTRSASASVGWFSSFFPLIHDVNSSCDDVQAFSDNFRRCKQVHCLSFSQDPVGYFTNPPAGEVLHPDSATPTILYNYLAVNASGASDGAQERFTLEPLLTQDFRGGDSPRVHPVDIVVLDAVEGVTILWRIDSRVNERVQASRWAERCHSLLADLSGRMGEQQETLHEEVYADSGLDTDELDQFLDSLK